MALALGTRRSTIAGISTALAALALAAAVAGRSCRVAPPGPEVTVRDVLQAAKAGDREVVLSLLTPATRARLDVEAKRATDMVGGAVRYDARDLLSISSSEGVGDPTDITLITEQGDRAVVEVVSPSGRARLELQKLDGHWRIDVPAFGANAQ